MTVESVMGEISIPVTLLPAQYYEAARQARKSTSGERRLLVAVFALAWADLTAIIRYAQAPGLTFPGRNSVEKRREELTRYFFEPSRGIYSLEYFCSEFGLNLGQMRQAVAAYAAFPRPLAKNEHYLHPSSNTCIRGHNCNAHNEMRRRDGRRYCRRCLESDRKQVRPRVNTVSARTVIRYANHTKDAEDLSLHQLSEDPANRDVPAGLDDWLSRSDLFGVPD